MAEKYSGGYILFCIERQVGAVIVVFLVSVHKKTPPWMVPSPAEKGGGGWRLYI